jgi:hypothetical protein
MANASFTLGMVASIADKLIAMKAGRDQANNVAGRDLVVLKSAVVDVELNWLDLKLTAVRSPNRMVTPEPYDAGGAAGASLAIDPTFGKPHDARDDRPMVAAGPRVRLSSGLSLPARDASPRARSCRR